MAKRILAPAFLIFLTTSTSSFAAASAEEAARILASFQSYLGSEPGVVAVVPAGEGYDITLDAMPYVRKNQTAGTTVDVLPFKFTAVPSGGNLWAVTSNAPIKIKVDVANLFTYDMNFPVVSWSGNYNSDLLAFLDSKTTMSKISIEQTSVDPTTNLKTNAVTSIDNAEAVITSKDTGNGTFDSDIVMSYSGTVTSTNMDLPPELANTGFPNLNYVANIGKTTYTSTAKGQLTRPVAELLAFFVARPSKELIVKDQALLKEKLMAALPLFQSIDGRMAMDDILVDTAYGQFKLTSGGIDVAMNGAVKSGRLLESFDFTGLKLPDTLPVPPWAKGLVPTTFKFGFDVSNFDLETPAKKFITEMDVTKSDPVPPGSEAAYLAAFLPTNSVKLTLPPGEISNDIYKLTYEGSSDISIAGGIPQVTAKVRMTGMDAVITQLQQAGTDPMAQQAMAVLFAAKGMSKADGDAVVWDVVLGADQKLFINGTDMTSLMGALGAPPPQQ
jgi:hypothetical protein